jgi:transcriptional regulator with XRE-family HTH domain
VVIGKNMKNSEYKAEIGRRISRSRGALGDTLGREISLAELSRLTGGLLSKTRIGNYEQGERMPGPAEANILAAALHVDAAWLLCLQQEFTPHQLEFLRNWMTLPENMREEYFQRIAALSMAFRKPLPDEEPTPATPARKPKATARSK